MNTISIETCSYCGMEPEPCVQMGWTSNEWFCMECIAGALEDAQEARKAWDCHCIIKHPRTKSAKEALKARLDQAVVDADWAGVQIMQAQLYGKCNAEARWEEYERSM